MLSLSKRLNLKKQFSWVVSGQKIEGVPFKLYYKFSSNKLSKVGIAVSSSVFKTAVDRNRARRLLSKAIEIIYSRLPENINIVAMPKKEILDYQADDLADMIRKVLEEKGIIK